MVARCRTRSQNKSRDLSPVPRPKSWISLAGKGHIRYLNTEDDLDSVINYVRGAQDQPRQH